MEKQLKCVLLLSLKDMALRRVAAVLLGSGSDILASILNFRRRAFDNEETVKEWRETVDEKIKDKLLKLEIPESLTKQLIDYVKTIGLEIRSWKRIHQDFFSCEEIDLPKSAKFCWTMVGTIDYRKTAEELVRCDALGFVERYKLACLYCLEDYIPRLWKKLPKKKKDFFCKAKVTKSDLHFCWPHILKGEHSKLDYLWRTSNRNLTSFNQWAFELSAEEGNKTAAEYFFQKLTHAEREASLMKTVHAVLANPNGISFIKEKLSVVLCYLLTLMIPEQQMEIVKAYPIDVLLCFFDRSWQDLFLANAALIWNFLPQSDYDDLLLRIADRFEYSGHYFSDFFREFFKQSPLDFKKKFVLPRPYAAHIFLYKLFRCEDSKSVEVIFRNLDAADRVRLVFDRHVLGLFYNSILRDRWDIVEVCLREAMLSKEDRVKLKKAFTGVIETSQKEFQCENRKFKRFFEFLDETNAIADERKKGKKRKLENCCPE